MFFSNLHSLICFCSSKSSIVLFIVANVAVSSVVSFKAFCSSSEALISAKSAFTKYFQSSDSSFSKAVL